MKYTYILLFTALLTFNLQSQGNINNNLTGATQSALIDFGNRSQRKAQPLNVQGSHYFIKDFKIAKLEYLGNAFIGYLVNIYDGKNDKLYLKRKKTFMEAKIARTSLENSFPPRYVESEELYISSNGDTPVKLKQSKKSIISYFKSNSDKVKKFIKSEKLKVSELSSIIKIFEFAENL